MVTDIRERVLRRRVQSLAVVLIVSLAFIPAFANQPGVGAEPLVETEPTTVTPGSTVTPGVLVVDDINHDSDQTLLELDDGRDLLGAYSLTSRDEETESVSSPIRLCFGSGTPDTVKAVAHRAIAAWASELQLTGPTIEVDLYWLPFGSPRSLGAAGPGRFVQDSRLPHPDSKYPVALANQLLGEDFAPRDPCDLSRDPEILVLINRSAGGDESLWNLSAEEPEPTQFDLESVLLHELAHGLGFISSPEIGQQDLAWPADGGVPFVFDRYLGQCLVEADSGCRLVTPLEVGNLEPLTSGEVWFDLPQLTDLELYAPATWDRGSSITHLDEVRYQGSLSLMTPFLEYGETQRVIDNGALAILQQLGYGIVRPPGDLLQVEAIPGDSTITVNIELDHISAGVPPLALDIELVDQAGVTTRTLSGFGPVLIDGLTNGETYRVRARGGNHGGQTAWVEAPATARPLALPPFVTVDDFLAVAAPVVGGAEISDRDKELLVSRARVVGASTVITELLQSQRSQTHESIARLYRGLLERVPEEAGFAFWVAEADRGRAASAIARSFAVAIEFTAGEPLTDSQLVQAVYSRVLQRSADGTGAEFWVAELAGGLDRGEFLLSLTNSDEHRLESDSAVFQDVVAFNLLSRLPTEDERIAWAFTESNGSREDVIDEIIQIIAEG